MSVDFDATLNSPIFAVLGVEATLSLPGQSDTFAITVLDKSSGVNVGTVEVPTVLPCAALQYSELLALGINKDDLTGGTLAFNGFTWRIDNTRPDPNPSGERAGQVYAVLSDQNELASSG